MRKSIIFALGLMLGVFGMTGCSKDAANEQINGGVEEFTLISHADAPDTRMVINGDKASGFKTAWEDGDQIGVYAMPASTTGVSTTYFTCNKAHTGTVANGIATFKGTIYSTNNADFNLFAYYPYTEGSTYKDTDYQSGVKCSLATVQTMNGNSFDKSCSYMVAKTGQTINTSAFDSSAKTANWQFRHTVAFINLGIKAITNSAVSGDEIVETVKIEVADKTLAGDFQFNLENGEMTFTDKQSAVIVDVPANTKLSDLSAWFVVNPFELTSADKLVVVISTQSHEITKEVTGKAKSFEAANVYTLNLTIDENCTIPAEDKYELVTDASTLDEGDKFVIVCVEKDVIATSEISSAYLKSGAVSVSSDGKTVGVVSNDNTCVFTLGGKAGAWTLSNADGKLLGATAVRKLAYNSGTTTWSISIDADNKATIQSTESGYGKFLYNANSPRFTTYTSNATISMLLPKIYRKSGPVTPTIKADDIVDVAAAGIENATATITLKGLDGVTVNATADGIVVTAASVSGNTLTYTVSKNETFEAREGKITLSAEGADDVTIKVSQLAKEAVTLTLSKETVELEATDTTLYEDITFKSDGTEVTAKAYNEEKGTSECDWLNVDISGTAIHYMAGANTGAERVAYIVVTATLDGDTASKSVKVTQKTALIGNPTNIKVTKVDATSLTATWDAVEHAKEYEWEIYPKNNTSTLCATGTVTSAALNLDINNLDSVTLLGDNFTKFAADTEYVLYVKSVAADGYKNTDAEFAKSEAFKYSEGGAAEEKTVTFDLTANEDFNKWDSGYTQRTLTYDAAKIVFVEANKQSSGATITDCPVTKGKDIQIILNNSKAKITAITITLKKWGSKTQTATLNYSTDGGTTYTATTTKSSTFVLSSKNLPEGTNAVKVTFNSQKNQVGCQKIEMTYVE